MTTITECFVGFAALNFSILNFPAYPTYFNEASYMQLAQAGQYYGPTDIEEYVRFATPSSPYVESLVGLESQQDFAGIDADGLCMFRTISKSRYRTSAPAVAVNADIMVMNKAYYNVSSAKLDRIFIYYSEAFLDFFFAVLLNTDSLRQSVCTTMRDSCSSTWSLNGYSSISQCTSALSSLPVARGGLYHIDGKSQGCRALHAVFAALNPNHCPHISFAPQIDFKGAFKCQSSGLVDPATLFSSSDLSAYETFGQSIGFDSRFLTVTDVCSSDADCPPTYQCGAGSQCEPVPCAWWCNLYTCSFSSCVHCDAGTDHPCVSILEETVCAPWCNSWTCGLSLCEGCPVCAAIESQTYCHSWCNAYTCGLSSCTPCAVCSDLAAGALCASWCNAYTQDMSFCLGCPP